MKIDIVENNGTLDDYINDAILRVICDMVRISDEATNEEKNKFVKLNIPKDIDDFIKSKIKDSSSMKSAYEEAKYTNPSFKETFEFELSNIYKKYIRINNESN